MGGRLIRSLLQSGRDLGCTEAWVLTDRSKVPARRLYASAGGVEAPGDTIMFEFRL